jgi:hypothetical protein
VPSLLSGGVSLMCVCLACGGHAASPVVYVAVKAIDP